MKDKKRHLKRLVGFQVSLPTRKQEALNVIDVLPRPKEEINISGGAKHILYLK